jgi:peptide/nickel transport system substrate-binding protein
MRISAPDPYTVLVQLSYPICSGSGLLGDEHSPAHLLEGKEITKSPLSRHPVGTGPYRFKEWIAGQKIVLEANPDYFEGRPLSTVISSGLFQIHRTMYMELKSGGIDLMGLTPVQFARQTGNADFASRFNKFRYPSSAYVYMGYNLRPHLFADKRIRQAVTTAIDKKEQVHGVLFGMGQTAHGPIVPGRWAYNPNVKDIAYNPEHARQLLAQAGWRDKNSQGILVKDGKPFSFTILTNQGNLQRKMTAEIIQQRLRHVGIDVKIRIVEWATFLKEFVDKGNFEVVLLGWGTGQDPDMYDIWHSSKTKPGELNFIG